MTVSLAHPARPTAGKGKSTKARAPRKPRAPKAATPAPAPTVSPVLEFGAEFAERLTNIRAHAATCGRLDCGHLGKSASLAVRRAVILYTAEGCGQGLTVDLTSEAPETVAVVGILREAGHARPVYTKGRTAAGGNGYVPGVAGMAMVWPSAEGVLGHPFKLTPQRLEVFGYALAGHSATDISSDPYRMVGGKTTPRVGLSKRNIETVKSHMGYLRRETGAHDAVSALLCLVKAGKLTDPAISFPSA